MVKHKCVQSLQCYGMISFTVILHVYNVVSIYLVQYNGEVFINFASVTSYTSPALLNFYYPTSLPHDFSKPLLIWNTGECPHYCYCCGSFVAVSCECGERGIILELLFVVFIVLFLCVLFFSEEVLWIKYSGDYHFERKFRGWVNYMRVGVMAGSKMYHLVTILGYYLGLIKWLLDSLICSKFNQFFYYLRINA